MKNVVSVALMLGALSLGGNVDAQSMYKYRGANGEWMFTDRPPPDERKVEVLNRVATHPRPGAKVFHRLVNRQIHLYGKNDFYAPVELILDLDELTNISFPPPEQSFSFVLQPQTETLLLRLDIVEYATAPSIAYHYRYFPGDPASQHQPDQPYRVPFAVANSHMVSQAYPYATTHMSADAHYAVDIVMPVGTNIYAARAGTVFEVASTNFRGGLNPEQEGAAANLIRILHHDGTYGVYAHLNLNTIRVKPGDVVRRGQYIADSGNTGYSTGPHLHFAVLRNAGMRSQSVPFLMEGPNQSIVVPTMGNSLTAY